MDKNVTIFFQDVERLSKNLTNLIDLYKVPLDTFNHVDFIWGKDAPTLVYKPLIKVIKKYSDANRDAMVNLV